MNQQGGLKVAAAGKPRHLVAAASVSAPAEGNANRVLARLVHFDYGLGKAVVTHVDIDAKKVVSVEEHDNYPAPVSKTERTLAIEKARKNNPKVAALYEKGEAGVKVDILVPVTSDKAAPTYGRRILDMRFYRERKEGEKANAAHEVIDLTDTPPAAAVAGANEFQVAAVENVTGTEEQFFPADGAENAWKTRWKVEYGLGTHLSSGEILYIKSAHYRRSPQDAWLKVLGDCRIAEIFVPYNRLGSPRFYDLQLGDLNPLTDSVLGPACLGPRKILNNRVAREVHDAGNLWIDHNFTPAKSVRNQELQLWSAFRAGNYIYLIQYTFGADGTVGFHLGATAHNYYDSKDDGTTHLHMGSWRLNVDLGNQAGNNIQMVRWNSNTATEQANTSVEPFNSNKEGALPWVAEQFSYLRIQSTTEKNSHNPKANIAYDLIPHRVGTPRIPEDWTQKEFWVSLPESASGVPQWNPKELVNYTAGQRSITGKAAVIWYHTGVVHSARDEDYGIEQYDAGEGVATTTWTGFKLKPRNLHSSTPHYP